MSEVLSIAVGRTTDEIQQWEAFEQALERLSSLGIASAPRELVIDPLSVNWHSPLEVDHFRSGCGPIEALAVAYREIAQGREPAVVIRGRDYLKSGYSSAQRQQAMAIYGSEAPLTEVYDQLTARFIEQQGISRPQFIELRDALFENYRRTYLSRGRIDTTSRRWFEGVTDLFRGIDCANPVVDFEGAILLVSEAAAQALGVDRAQCVVVESVGLGALAVDGPAGLADIARYEHLTAAFTAAFKPLKSPMLPAFERGEVLLDLYTCYPVVPLAALLCGGFVDDVEGLSAFIDTHPLTQTGGMNLARGAWNNPALNGLITMYERLVTCSSNTHDPIRYGVVHGNGGAGYRQGVAVLSPAKKAL